MKRILLLSLAFLLIQGSLVTYGRTGSPSSDEQYSIVILGDTHFDAEPAEKYHSFYNEKVEWLNRVQRQEFARNGEMWRERCPRMVSRASRLIDDDTRMVFQTGDLIQGDCGNPEVHKQMLCDVMDSFKSRLGGLPFITVTGNHDIRGTGAKEAYHRYMPERLSEELGQKVSGTSFYFTIGPDAFIVVDFNSHDIDGIRKCLKKTAGARYTFVLTHGPVFPYDAANCRWFLLGNSKFTDLRRELRDEMAARNVICLCGHTHRIELADWFSPEGRITQMTMNSVWSSDALANLTVDADSPEQYGTLRKGAIKDDGTPAADESDLFDEYRPGLKRYFHAKGAGAFKLNVSAHGVYVDFYGGDSEAITRSFVLR